jgi:hypothetical protein
MKKPYGILVIPNKKEKSSYWASLRNVIQEYETEDAAQKDYLSLVKNKDQWCWKSEFQIALFSDHPKIK